jgi:tetratricopeptide (TPR) repeat protein
MWSAAGLRVSSQENFHANDPENVRAMYRRHARGNSSYKNLGNGKFQNVAAENGTEYGGWAWSSDSWDFDHDGHADIYVTNGYISGADQFEISSFFWRHVVGNSPAQFSSAQNYEQGWNSVNELIRSDRSWSAPERNVCYWNNGDGTFSDTSGISGLDLPDDGRAFALADLDHDGRLEILVKNRNAPQLRLLRNSMTEIGNSVAFRLKGTKSNRDAIGAAITVEAAGHTQTRYVQAGSGFLSQHTKEVFFGVADAIGFVKATVRWPSGVTQILEQVPVNHRVEVQEGRSTLRTTPFATAPRMSSPATPAVPEALPESLETWLLQPLRAPSFSLPDRAGKTWDLHSISGNKLLTFWGTASADSHEQLRSVTKYEQHAATLQILAVNLDESPDAAAIRSFVSSEAIPFPVLIGTPEVAGIYNIVFRYLFDRHRDLGLPTSFLIDSDGMIAKVYQGVVSAERIATDLRRLPRTAAERQRLGLPFPGTLQLGAFQRNDFTYGVAFFQRGYLDAAAESFKQVITSEPSNAEANYNLGTLYLRRNDPASARLYLEKAVQLKPQHTEAWNNLGMLDAQEGRTGEAIQDFKQCLAARPDYVVGLLNLGNLYRHEKKFPEAEELLKRALQLEPENAEANYGLGMLYAQESQAANAEQSFDRAIKLRPDYGDALNNFGVLLVREQRYSEAESKFLSCIQSNPNFDQAYLNLARLYVLLNAKDKAREILESLLRLQPEHPVARQALEVLR